MTEEAKQGIIDTAIKVAREFGLPVIMLAVTVYLFREAAISLHQTLLVPVVQTHTEFIKATQENLREISVSQNKQAETLHELAEGQRDIQRAISNEKP